MNRYADETIEEFENRKKNIRNRENKARRLADRLGYRIEKLRGNFHRDYGEAYQLISNDGFNTAILYGNNGGVELEDVEECLGNMKAK